MPGHSPPQQVVFRVKANLFFDIRNPIQAYICLFWSCFLQVHALHVLLVSLGDVVKQKMWDVFFPYATFIYNAAIKKYDAPACLLKTADNNAQWPAAAHKVRRLQCQRPRIPTLRWPASLLASVQWTPDTKTFDTATPSNIPRVVCAWTPIWHNPQWEASVIIFQTTQN